LTQSLKTSSSNLDIVYAVNAKVLNEAGNSIPSTRNARNIGDFNLSTGAFSVIDISRPDARDLFLYSGGGVLAANGHMYMVPLNSENAGELKMGNREPGYAVEGDLSEVWSALLLPPFNGAVDVDQEHPCLSIFSGF